MTVLELTTAKEFRMIWRKVPLKDNPGGGSFPVDVSGFKFLTTTDSHLPASVELHMRRPEQPHKEISPYAKAVFYPELHYEMVGGKLKPIYGDPKFIPNASFRGGTSI